MSENLAPEIESTQPPELGEIASRRSCCPAAAPKLVKRAGAVGVG